MNRWGFVARVMCSQKVEVKEVADRLETFWGGGPLSMLTISQQEEFFHSVIRQQQGTFRSQRVGSLHLADEKIREISRKEIAALEGSDRGAREIWRRQQGWEDEGSCKGEGGGGGRKARGCTRNGGKMDE
eukprot:375436-Hanusia_phi.AAC.1